MLDRRQRRLGRAMVAGGWFMGASVNLAAPFALVDYPMAMALVLSALGFVLGARALDARGAVPIIVYHSVSGSSDWLPWADNTSVRPEVFRAHLKVLRRGAWHVTDSWSLHQARRDGAPLPRRTLAIHFDDGYLDNYVAAVPLLREAGFPATFFVSTDFIDPSSTPRPQYGSDAAIRWDGYMNAAEIREIDADPLFEIACHGADHGRVAVGPGPADSLTPENWKSHAPWLWARTPGNKSQWYKASVPDCPFGTPVPETDSALCASAWDPETGAEPDTSRRRRVLQSLRTSRDVLQSVLRREVSFICWPFDRVTEETLTLARRAGFTLFTGGRGENRAGEAPDILSRVHINDHAAGRGLPIWVEALVFRARLGVAAGELWFLPVTWAASRLRGRAIEIQHVPVARTQTSEAR